MRRVNYSVLAKSRTWRLLSFERSYAGMMSFDRHVRMVGHGRPPLFIAESADVFAMHNQWMNMTSNPNRVFVFNGDCYRDTGCFGIYVWGDEDRPSEDDVQYEFAYSWTKDEPPLQDMRSALAKASGDEWLARRMAFRDDDIAAMSRSGDWHMRHAAAICVFRHYSCHYTGDDLVLRLMNDEEYAVRKEAAMGFWNWWSDEHLSAEFNDGMSRCALDRHRLRMIDTLMKDPDWRVRMELCLHPIVFHYVDEYAGLANDPEYEVRLAFASMAARLDRDDRRFEVVARAAMANACNDDFMGDLLVRLSGGVDD